MSGANRVVLLYYATLDQGAFTAALLNEESRKQLGLEWSLHQIKENPCGKIENTESRNSPRDYAQSILQAIPPRFEDS